MTHYTKYMADAARERRMWCALTRAACGNTVYLLAWDERYASDVFDMYVKALESIGLDGLMWSARKTNGNKRIRFENGGELRFVSYRSQYLHGTRAGAVVMDA